MSDDDVQLRVESNPGGHHKIIDDRSGICLVHVRATGLLMFGEFLRDGVFAHDWVRLFIPALELAERIASRKKPWEPWVESADPPSHGPSWRRQELANVRRLKQVDP